MPVHVGWFRALATGGGAAGPYAARFRRRQHHHVGSSLICVCVTHMPSPLHQMDSRRELEEERAASKALHSHCTATAPSDSATFRIAGGSFGVLTATCALDGQRGVATLSWLHWTLNVGAHTVTSKSRYLRVEPRRQNDVTLRVKIPAENLRIVCTI